MVEYGTSAAAIAAPIAAFICAVVEYGTSAAAIIAATTGVGGIWNQSVAAAPSLIQSAVSPR